MKRTVRKRFAAIRACFDDSVTRRDAGDEEGGVAVTFGIDPDGVVVSPRVSSASVTDPDIQACVEARFAELRFPPPPDGWVLATYPVRFDAEPSDEKTP